jgi:[NiFe] hydrogenase diaphorase moiety large subunit
LSADDFELEINNEDMLCGGAVTIFNASREVLEVIRNYNNFFVSESCGLCTPCRAGNYLISKKLKRIKKGKGDYEDLEELLQWSKIIQKTSRCGLGKTSCNAVIQMLEKFSGEVERLIHDNGLELEHEFDVNEYTHDYSDFALKMNHHG